MRLILLLLIFTTTSLALEIPFLNALSLPITLEDYFPPSYTANDTARRQQQQESKKFLHKRQMNNGCPDNFHACTNLGAPGLCCADAAVCRPDDNGNVACCPSSSSCTGRVNGVITSGTVNSDGSLIAGGGGATRTTANSRSPVGSNSNNVVISSNPPSSTTPGPSGSQSAFVLNGGSGFGAMARRAEIPLVGNVILMILWYLPI